MIQPKPEQIKKWINKNAGDFKVAKRGIEIRINNLLDPSDDGYHLWINLDKAIVNDFRPSYKDKSRGTFINYVMKCKKLSFKEAVKDVMGNIDFSKYSKNDKKLLLNDELDTPFESIDLPHGYKSLEESNNKISESVVSYLNSRKVFYDKIIQNRIGYCGLSVVFPYVLDSELVYWQSRSIVEKRFEFPEGTNKSDFVYGLDNIDPTEPIILTESIFNSLMFDNGSAVGGSDISDSQKRLLKSIGVDTIIIAFDYDLAGVCGTAKAYDILNPYFNLYYSFTYIKDVDWNDIAKNSSIDECRRILNKNMKRLDFKEKIKLKRIKL